MAFSAGVEWEVRTTGSDTNGGGWNAASSGTDYSQQDSPQVTYTDLVIGATTTQITSVAFPFTALHVGNIINITSGTGFTVQRVEVISVAATVATCDKSVGTAASTGGNGKLGGGLATTTLAVTLPNTGNTVHIKAGTYTVTAITQIAGVNHTWVGYQTTHNDRGTKPLITTATNSATLFAIGAGHLFWRNISFSNTASTRDGCLNANGNFPAIVAVDCIFDGFTWAIESLGGNFGHVSVFGCAFKNYTTSSRCIYMPFRGEVHGCWFTGGTNASSLAVAAANGISVTHTIFSSLAGSAVDFANGNSCCFVNCSFYAVAKNCIGSASNFQALLANNIFYLCATGAGGPAAINGNSSTEGAQGYNAFGANGTDRAGTMYNSFQDITLSADPFTNAAGDDFTLNSTAGGGALLKSLGFQWGA